MCLSTTVAQKGHSKLTHFQIRHLNSTLLNWTCCHVAKACSVTMTLKLGVISGQLGGSTNAGMERTTVLDF